MHAEPRTEPAVRVSTLELFFDLVFVFTITQLTARLAGELTVPGLLRVMLMLGVIWWMYGGYAWLTNAVAPTDALRRALLIAGMAGFLAIAVAVPDAFGRSGWVFGAGYFAVNLVHSGLFWHGGGPGAAAALRGLGPLNLASASLVLAGGLLPGGWREVAWAAALAVQIASPYLHPIGGFTVSPAHFVERHGLVVIVALGESVVAIGLGIVGHLSARLLGVAVLGLLLAYCLWWAYFGGDDERAEHALAGIPDPRRRALAAVVGYGYAHYVLLLGIVLLATGVKVVIGHPFEHAGLARSMALGGGTAVFFLGDLFFRRALRIGRPWYRTACAAVGLASVPLGLLLSVAQLAALAAAVALLLAVEGRTARGAGPRPG
ncbi:MAG: low temperature requirement protein A [Micromonosporaceae bacterium]|nr:low temperature requirement protein A [Micromonosporaceae bacterium]